MILADHNLHRTASAFDSVNAFITRARNWVF